MDSTLVLYRTAAGEVAVGQPIRIVQRNLRAALMLVDGRRQVADVVARFGDVAVGEAALADLLRTGLIETAEMRARRGAEQSPPPSAPPATPAPAVGPLPSQVTEIDPRAATGIVESITIGGVEGDERVLPRPRIVSPTPAPKTSDDAAAPRSPAPPPVARPAAASAATRRPLRPKARRVRRPWASAVLALVMLVLGLVAALRFYPYERHVAQLEQRLSAALGEPVAIGRLHVSFAPYPSIALDEVGIGAGRRITVGSIRFLPDPLALIGDRLAVRDVQLDRIDLTGSALELLTRLASGGSGAEAISIGGLRFADATVRFPDTVLTGLRGEAGTTPGALRFTAADGSLSGELRNTEDGLRVRLISLDGWAPDFLAPLALDRFDAEGRFERGTLLLDKVYARLADGSVTGSASVAFGSQTRIGAELEMKHVSLNKLLSLSKADVLAQGSASGLLKVGGPASGADSGNGLVFEGSVTVHNGSLQGFDLVEAVRSANRGAVRGGSTRFEEFAGQVRVDGRAWRISRLRLQAGLMRADGQVAGGRDRKMAGLVNVELRGSAGSMRVPVSVTGSLRDPVLSASRLTGAATAPEPS